MGPPAEQPEWAFINRVNVGCKLDPDALPYEEGSDMVEHLIRSIKAALTDAASPSPVEELRKQVAGIADEANRYLGQFGHLDATPSWLLKLYGLGVSVERPEPKKPWGQRDRQA